MSEASIVILGLLAIGSLVSVIFVLLRSNQRLTERLTALTVAEDYRQFVRLTEGPAKPTPPRKTDEKPLPTLNLG